VIESPALRRAVLAVLILLAVGCLAVVALVVATRGAGDGIGDRLSSLQDDEVPGASVSGTREQLLARARDFAVRFNTYAPSMLDDQGHLPEYASVSELMTPKFAGFFEEAVELPEQTVKQYGAASVGTVYAVGVASQDDDSAELLVAGTIELSYPYPDDKGGKGGDQTDGDPEDEERLSTGPQRFRYEVSMVKIDGTWLVDDVDDIDDGKPPFSQPAIPEEEGTPGQTPSTPPATTPPSSPSDSPATEKGQG
jgi:Mce-associated membrane protein